MNYPTEVWLANYLASHPDKSKEDADCAWWDKEIDAGRPTPYDLQGEQAKNAKQIVRKPANYSLAGKTPRARKPNEEKREIIQKLSNVFSNAEIVNPEKEITFSIGENQYSISLVLHRKKT